LALLSSCATSGAPLNVLVEPGETEATRVYQVDEVAFEAPAGWVSQVNARAFLLVGGSGCSPPSEWGDATLLAVEGQVARSPCPTLVIAPATDMSNAECLNEEVFGKRNRWLASSTEVSRKRDTIDLRLARRFDWKSQPPPGRAVAWCVCAPSRPWYFTLWIPAGAEAEGAAALRLFQRTVKVGQAWLAP
jgi:hypothetical protein